MTLIPIALFWLLALRAASSPGPLLLHLFFAGLAFGAFAVIPPALTGGLTITPMPVLSLLLVARAFGRRGKLGGGLESLLAMALAPRQLLLLTLFWLVALVATLFLPHLFAGSVIVVPVRGLLDSTAPLRPTMQNLSQLAYLTISVATVFAFARLLRDPALRQQALAALCTGGMVTAMTGLVDFAGQYLPLAPLLQPLRTGTYAMLTDVEVLGAKRVVGLMPEASAYGGLCLSFLCTLHFFRRAIADRRLRNVHVPLAIGLLAGCAALSISSGTYIGLALFALVAALEWLMRAVLHGRGPAGELAITVALVCAAALAVIVHPQVFDPVRAMVERMVFEKQASLSFAERGMWRSTAIAALQATHGLGVGLGGTRASSSLVAVFSCTGLLGGALYHGFVLQSLLRRAPRAPAEVQRVLSAFRFAFVPPFVVSLMVGDADFGGVLAFGLGITAAVSHGAARTRSPSLVRQFRIEPLPAQRQHPE